MSLSSNNDEGEDSSFAYWPKFDSCLGSTFDACLVSNGTAQWDPISMNWATLTDNLSASASRSELPPPPSAWEKEDSMYGFELEATPRKYLALSASIWGPGWHQVEPLPPSFIKTLELNELELQAQAQALALEKAALATANPKAIAKRAKREAKAAAAAAAKEQREGQKSCDIDMTDANATSQRQAIHSSEGSSCQSIAPMNALCSSRLPRSLQFVD
ncbi:hypothetical protein FBU30_009304 [Linnemannia zychae]|nr:hypothetical protein FBU30_009304 [Linnemannia zychae]